MMMLITRPSVSHVRVEYETCCNFEVKAKNTSAISALSHLKIHLLG